MKRSRKPFKTVNPSVEKRGRKLFLDEVTRQLKKELQPGARVTGRHFGGETVRARPAVRPGSSRGFGRGKGEPREIVIMFVIIMIHALLVVRRA